VYLSLLEQKQHQSLAKPDKIKFFNEPKQTELAKHKHGVNTSLRNERFCGVREQRITARKMERVKEGGGGGEGRKKTLADKPLDFENRPLGLSCLSAHTEILCCHRLS